MDNVVLIDVIAAAILGLQLVAFMLKRDQQDKYTLIPILLPSLMLLYLVIAPELSKADGAAFSPFEKRVLAYQAGAFVMAILSRFEGQMGMMGFWLATLANLGSAGFLIYLGHFWTM